MVSCDVIDCCWTTTDNNATIAQVSQEFTDHMTMHTLNAAIMAIAREGVAFSGILPEKAARNVVVKQRNARSYGKEMAFNEYVKILAEWDEGSLDPPATKQN